MKKILIILLLDLLFSNTVFAETYHFKGCKLSNTVVGDYIINLDKKVIEVTLVAVDGTIQYFSDKIKLIEKDQIVSDKIESGKGDKIYFEYYLNAKSKTVTKLQYKKESGIDMDLFKLQLKKTNDCSDVKAGWNKDKIKKAEISKETKQILKAQEKIKKEQSSIIKCEGNNYKQWTNCKGSYKAETGHKYDGIFKNGKILKGTASFPGGATYIGEFKDYKPHGYGNFVWKDGKVEDLPTLPKFNVAHEILNRSIKLL